MLIVIAFHVKYKWNDVATQSLTYMQMIKGNVTTS
jgi:hypothetical protein